MNTNKFDYTKPQPSKTPDESTNHHTKTAEEKKVNSFQAAPNYQKEEGFLSPNLIFVLSGGSEDEKKFFKQMKDIRSVRIIFMSQQNQGLQPFQMEKRWEKIREDNFFSSNGMTYHLDQLDKVFLISDVDEFYEQLKIIVNNKNANDQAQWIISNPCFEIWIYYCNLNNVENDLECLRSITVDKRSKKLKSMGPQLVSGGFNAVRAFENMHKGIANSKSHFDIDANGIPTLFATNMHLLAEYLIKAMESKLEYSKFLSNKEEHRRKMKNSRS